MSKENHQQDNLVDIDSKNLQEVLPTMNIVSPDKQGEQNLITDDALLGIYGNILDMLKSDRNEIDEIIAKFGDMVFNDGDATTSSKEALINLIKLKVDSADKMSKVADLMTRVKLKEKDTFPRYLTANQNNTINVGDSQKKALIQAINKAQKAKGK